MKKKSRDYRISAGSTSCDLLCCFHRTSLAHNKAVTKIVTFLWNAADVVTLIANCDEREKGFQWQQIEVKVNDKISLLSPLPASLREKLLSLVKPIGDEIWEWKWTHIEKFQFKSIPREFCWTPQGTVDKKRMAEAFIHDLGIPEEERYDMACLYCLEWVGPIPFHGTESLTVRGFKTYWTYDRTGDMTALHSMWGRDPSMTPYQQAFDYAVDYSNDIAAEYYFGKLSPGERESSLSNIQLSDSFIDLDFFRFLLQHIEEGQQSQVLEEHIEDLLMSLLDWPWQPLFMDGVRRVRDILNLNQYSSLLSRIVEKIRKGYKDYCYRELLAELWGQMPADQKRERISDSYFLDDLFRIVDEENIPFMLRCLSPEEKEQILFSEGGICICKSLAHDGEWEALELFIGECITSREEMIRFKEKFDEEYMFFNRSFYELLDELIEKFSNKRGGEEADCSVSKRLCRSSDTSIDLV